MASDYADLCARSRGAHGAGELNAPHNRELRIISAQNEPSKLPLTAVVGELDVAILEKEDEPIPLPMEIAECPAERGLGWNECALLVDEGTEVGEHGADVLVPPGPTLLGVVAREHRDALDREEASDLAHGLEGDRVARARGLHEPSPPVDSTSRALGPRSWR